MFLLYSCFSDLCLQGIHFFPGGDFSCDTGAIRLSPLTSNNTDVLGRLEVCYDGYWGSVCDDFATKVTADVACRHLGHREGKLCHHVLPMH